MYGIIIITKDRKSQNNSLLEEARTLTGEWEGSMVYEYTDDSTKKRVSDQLKQI